MANEVNNMSAQASVKPSPSLLGLAETINDVTSTYNERSITYNGSLQDFDYSALLRDKQKNINRFYELADYFVDADDLVGGAIRHIYVPFSMLDKWYLTGGNEQVRAKYQEWFEKIGLNDKLRSWFYQYYVFHNVYFCLMDDHDLVTLPPHMVRITNITVNGNPLIEFDVRR